MGVLARSLPRNQAHLVGNIVSSVFTPVLAKHSKSFSLVDAISVGVDRMQRNFEPMREQVELWRQAELTDVSAKDDHLSGFHRERIGGSPAPGVSCARSVFRSTIR